MTELHLSLIFVPAIYEDVIGWLEFTLPFQCKTSSTSSSHNIKISTAHGSNSVLTHFWRSLSLSFLSQDQFLLNGTSGAGIWIVPITLGCCSHDKQKRLLLKHKHDNIKAIVSQCDSRQKGGNFWIKLNIDETGFYRVKYDDELTAALRNALQAKKLSLMDEIGKHNLWHY